MYIANKQCDCFFLQGSKLTNFLSICAVSDVEVLILFEISKKGICEEKGEGRLQIASRSRSLIRDKEVRMCCGCCCCFWQCVCYDSEHKIQYTMSMRYSISGIRRLINTVLLYYFLLLLSFRWLSWAGCLLPSHLIILHSFHLFPFCLSFFVPFWQPFSAITFFVQFA